MNFCFVIQPFDKGSFDKRYDEIFVAAIKNAGIDPYRVDRDPDVIVPIEKIEEKIQDACICLADISLDNPNVWLELGLAIAYKKQIIIVCSSQREIIPFDVQHRKIIRYVMESPSEFEKFKLEITESIRARLQRNENFDKISSSVKETEGLSPHEIIVLFSMLKNRTSSKDPIFPADIYNDLEREGFNRAGANVALMKLERKVMIESQENQDFNGNSYSTYLLTPKGENWIIHNENYLNLRTHIRSEQNKSNDDIPF